MSEQKAFRCKANPPCKRGMWFTSEPGGSTMKKIYVIVVVGVSVLLLFCLGIRVGKFVVKQSKGTVHYIDDFE